MGLFDFFKKKKVELPEEAKKWNKMWDLWAKGKAASPYAELMTYQGEINNGGHDQYFTNVQNTGDLQKEIFVLESILSQNMKDNLRKAYAAYLILEEKEEDEEAEEILGHCDNVFYENEAEIGCILEEYAATMKV